MMIKTELHWSYQPPDYFEVTTTVELPSGVLNAKSGAMVFTLTEPEQPLGDEMRKTATKQVLAVFQARQLLTHREFKLDGPNAVHHDANGKRHYVVFPEPGVMRLTGFAPDIIITDKDGNVVKDTRAERQESETSLVQLLAPKIAKSDTLAGMLRSFQNAIEDADGELNHLYEIRDAAVKALGSRTEVEKKLGLTKGDYDVLGKLGNVERLRQGRHRGKGVERDATPKELAEARRIARLIIERFAAIL
jgi:hypothetical protein